MPGCATHERFRRAMSTVLLAGCLAAGTAIAQQVADLDFDTRVARPAYTGAGPRVLVDEAHRNFHTTDGRYKPFADLLKHDGYQVTANTAFFTPATLSGHAVLVIANATGAETPAASAFTDDECAAVADWVRALADGVLSLTATPLRDAWQLAQLDRELSRIADAAAGGSRTELRVADMRALLDRR